MFGKKLKQLRTKNRLSLQRLGDELGMSKQTLSDYEKEKAFPRVKGLLDIANFFQVSLDYLLKEQVVFNTDIVLCAEDLSLYESGFLDKKQLTPDVRIGNMLYANCVVDVEEEYERIYYEEFNEKYGIGKKDIITKFEFLEDISSFDNSMNSLLFMTDTFFSVEDLLHLFDQEKLIINQNKEIPTITMSDEFVLCCMLFNAGLKEVVIDVSQSILSHVRCDVDWMLTQSGRSKYRKQVAKILESHFSHEVIDIQDLSMKENDFTSLLLNISRVDKVQDEDYLDFVDRYRSLDDLSSMNEYLRNELVSSIYFGEVKVNLVDSKTKWVYKFPDGLDNRMLENDESLAIDCLIANFVLSVEFKNFYYKTILKKLLALGVELSIEDFDDIHFERYVNIRTFGRFIRNHKIMRRKYSSETNKKVMKIIRCILIKKLEKIE